MRQSQVSVETVILFGFITMMLIPASILFFEYLVKSTDDIVENRVSRIGKSFVENVNLMYNYGEKAKIVVDYSFPDHILNMSIENENMLVFTIRTQEDIVPLLYDLGINVTGNFNESAWSEGDKSFEFKTIPGGDVVSIRLL